MHECALYSDPDLYDLLFPAVRDGSWQVIATGADRTSRVDGYRNGSLASTTQFTNRQAPFAFSQNRYDSFGRLAETRVYKDLSLAATDTDFSLSASTNGLVSTAYTYYADDQVYTVTSPDPNGTSASLQVTTNTYNERGLLARRQLPDLSEIFYTYTPQGQLDRVQGSQTYPLHYEYDSHGRMVRMITWKDFAGDTSNLSTFPATPPSAK